MHSDLFNPTAVNMATILSAGLTPINSFGSVDRG